MWVPVDLSNGLDKDLDPKPVEREHEARLAWLLGDREEGVEPTNNDAEVRFVGQKPSLHKSGDWPQVERRPLLTT